MLMPSLTRGRLVPVAIPLLLSIMQAESAAAPLTKDQQTCSAVLSSGFDRVADTLGDEILACIKRAALGKLAGTVDDCIDAGSTEKVDKAAAKTATDFTKKCAGENRPPFGVTSAAAVTAAAIGGDLDLLGDVVGPPPIDGVVLRETADKPGARCQQGVLREADKCRGIKVAQFNQCVKAGLKDKTAPFDDPGDIADCIGVDATGAIARQCDLRETTSSGKIKVDALRKVIASACVDEGVGLNTAFPGCGESDAEATHACIERAIECRVCLALDRAAGLDRDCDVFDDGEANESCLPGPLVIGSHQCVLDNITSPFHLDTASVGLRLDASGVIHLDCGEVDPSTSRAPCSCAIEAIDPIAVLPFGFACFAPAAGCATGVIDCDGGEGLDAALLSMHDIGTCTDPGDCATQCDAECAVGGSTALESGCEGFCRGGANDGAACAVDSACVGGLCIGPDFVAHGNICQCQCVGIGGAPSRPGALQCDLGVAITIERNPPCGNGDLLADLGQRCVPLTTESLHAVIADGNAVPMAEIPPGGNALTGLPVSCPTLAADNTAGLSLVTAVNVLDAPAAGDVATAFTFDCL